MNHTTWAAGGKGNASVKGVDLVSCWKVGRRNAVRALAAHSAYAGVVVEHFDALKHEDITMFYPDG